MNLATCIDDSWHVMRADCLRWPTLRAGAELARAAGLAWRVWRHARRCRAALAQLARLDDRLLRDIGLDPRAFEVLRPALPGPLIARAEPR